MTKSRCTGIDRCSGFLIFWRRFVISDFDNLKFLHPVGVSTFKYGVTIPLEAQTERLRAIEKGGKVTVTVPKIYFPEN
jgi:hypothetical protein